MSPSDPFFFGTKSHFRSFEEDFSTLESRWRIFFVEDQFNGNKVLTANEDEEKNIGLREGSKNLPYQVAWSYVIKALSSLPRVSAKSIVRTEAKGRGFESNTQKNRLTFLLHVDLEALLEPAGLALVAAGDVHHAVPVLLAHVVQVPVVRDKVQGVNF